MEHFAGATKLNDKYDIDQAQLLGRGKLSVVHRTRRHAAMPSARLRARMQACLQPHPVHARPTAASRRADGQLVVLKKIEIFEMGKTERSECMNEIELLRQMQHPHIISYLDCVLEVRARRLLHARAEPTGVTRSRALIRLALPAPSRTRRPML